NFAARPDRHPAGDQGDRRPPGGHRGALMADPLSLFAPSGNGSTVAPRLRQQAEELEGVFLNTLTKQMFASVQTENGFGGGFAEETWRSMQAEQFAATIASAG